MSHGQAVAGLCPGPCLVCRAERPTRDQLDLPAWLPLPAWDAAAGERPPRWPPQGGDAGWQGRDRQGLGGCTDGGPCRAERRPPNPGEVAQLCQPATRASCIRVSWGLCFSGMMVPGLCDSCLLEHPASQVIDSYLLSTYCVFRLGLRCEARAGSALSPSPGNADPGPLEWRQNPAARSK